MGFEKPLEIKLQITEKCNYSCEFCFNKQAFAKGKEMPAEVAKAIISKVAKEGIEKIRFTGGEPLLHPALPNLISHAKAKGLSITLNTNASLFNKALLEKVSGNLDTALISMHSLPLNENSSKAASFLSKAGCETRCATILSKESIQNLEAFHKAFQEGDFSQWVLLRQIPNALNKSPVSSQDMAVAVSKISSLNSGRKEKFLIENALPFCCFEPEQVEKIALGGIHEDGHSSLFVDCLSRIRPSYFFDIFLGDALHTPFLKAWNSDFMQRMNSLEFIPEICHECTYALKCMAGSRFSAFLAHGSLYALDPLAKPGLFATKPKRNK